MCGGGAYTLITITEIMAEDDFMYNMEVNKSKIKFTRVGLMFHPVSFTLSHYLRSRSRFIALL